MNSRNSFSSYSFEFFQNGSGWRRTSWAVLTETWVGVLWGQKCSQGFDGSVLSSTRADTPGAAWLQPATLQNLPLCLRLSRPGRPCVRFPLKCCSRARASADLKRSRNGTWTVARVHARSGGAFIFGSRDRMRPCGLSPLLGPALSCLDPFGSSQDLLLCPPWAMALAVRAPGYGSERGSQSTGRDPWISVFPAPAARWQRPRSPVHFSSWLKGFFYGGENDQRRVSPN